MWPGVLHSPRGSTAPSSRDSGGIATIGTGAPAVTGTFDGVPGRDGGRPVGRGRRACLSSLPTAAARSSAAPSSVLAQPSVYYTLPPSSASASSPAEPSFGPPATGSAGHPGAVVAAEVEFTDAERRPHDQTARHAAVEGASHHAGPDADRVRLHPDGDAERGSSVSSPTAPPPDPSPSSASPTASPTVSPTVSPSTVAPPVSAAS